MKNPNIIQNSSDAIYTCDPNGFIKSYNKAAVNLWGREPIVGKDLWCGSWKIFDKNGGHLPFDKHPMAVALREGRLVHGEELIVQRPDGSVRFISPYASPLVNSEGQLTGVVSLLIEISEQKFKEKQSGEMYSNLIEQAADGIFLFDADGNFISANTSGCDMLGYDKTNLLQLNIRDILPPQFADKLPVDPVRLNAGEPLLVERMFKRNDGSLFYTELRAQKAPDGNIQAIVRDITERKKTAEALKESEFFNKNVLASITSHIAVVENNGNIIFVNKAWEDFSQKSGNCAQERSSAGTNYIKACEKAISNGSALSADSLHGFYQVVNGTVSVFEMEYPCQSDGENLWFLLRISRFTDNSPKVVIKHIDITARVDAYNNMRQALERYDVLEKATSDIIWDWDVIQNRIRYNDGITKMFGYQSASIEDPAAWWKQNIHPDDFEAVNTALNEIFASKSSFFQMEYRFRCADGSYKYVFDRAFVIFGSYGKPERMIGAMQDISERKDAEQKFRVMRRAMMNQKVEEQKKITRAIINAQEIERRRIGEELHDNINQMLAGVKLYLSVAGNDNVSIKGILQYPVQLLEDTMNEIRLLTKRSVTPKQNVNLSELLQTLVDMMFMKPAVATKLDCQVDDALLDDELKLNIYRIIQEQSNNIIKYAGAANVEISVVAKDNIIDIAVIDDGHGFDMNKKREGVGINNIMNRVESFNGEVLISTEPGNGCKLLIKIPY